MIEGLAVWGLFIFGLTKLGMPWNIFTKAFSVIGGFLWLVFVWIGLIAWSPMDMTGGAVVQAPHIQLRPISSDITGEMTALHIEPNQKVKAGQVVFEIDNTNFSNQLNQVNNDLIIAKEELKTSKQNLEITKTSSENSKLEIDNLNSQISNKNFELSLAQNNYNRLAKQNKTVKGTVTESDLDSSLTTLNIKKGDLKTLEIALKKANVNKDKSLLDIEKAMIEITKSEQKINTLTEKKELLEWKVEASKVKAPADGFVTNFVSREGQFMGLVPRMHMYTEEKYILFVIGHQGIRNIKEGQYAEFATPVYPGKVFKGKVQSVIEATGESQGSLLAKEDSVTQTLVKKRRGRYHFVRVEIEEPDGYDIPLGSYGIGWISAEKPHSALGFLDVIRGIIIRMKSQIYYVYSL